LRPRYRFPDRMRPASLQERHEFYKQEFNSNLVQEWFRAWTKPIVFAVVIGRHTKIFPAQYRRDRDRTILIDEYDTVQDLRRYCIEFRPESVYYDRNLYSNWDEARRGSNKIEELGKSFGQQLAFDIDPENFECPIHGTLEDKMNKRQGLSFCRLELQLAQEQPLELTDEFSKSFSKLRIVYSGRGFHVHVLDEDTFFWTRKQRLALVRSLVRRGYLMDEWVAGGGMRLIRLPHSLNGLVSRLARPLDVLKVHAFDPVTDRYCLPGFARC
jgi:DNA primase catalytic subunit